MAEWRIEKLNKKHDRGAFTCGVPALDVFLKTLVSQYAKNKLGQTFVAVKEDSARVFGFYTASSASFLIGALPERARQRLPKHPVPSIHLGRLGVDQSVQGTGLGKTLLFHFLFRSVLIADQIGVHAVDLYAKDESGRAFYEKYGFLQLEDNPLHLYLPIATLEQMFGREEIEKRRQAINLPERISKAAESAPPSTQEDQDKSP